MPTLPEAPERTAGGAERVGNAVRRVGSAVGVDTRVSARVLVFFTVAAVAASTAPMPWAQVAIVALLGLALDWTRKRTI
jgi:hypothetical protein